VETVTGDLTVRAASGDVKVGRVAGDLTVNSASGDLHAQHIDGSITVQTASGDVKIGEIGKGAKVNTASGDITITKLIGGHTKINSASGDIEVGVTPGAGVYMDVSSMSGRARSELDTASTPSTNNDPDVILHLRSMSGDITVKRG